MCGWVGVGGQGFRTTQPSVLSGSQRNPGPRTFCFFSFFPSKFDCDDGVIWAVPCAQILKLLLRCRIFLYNSRHTFTSGAARRRGNKIA